MSIIRDGTQSADLDVPVASPTLNLDFANSQSLDPRITFTRGSVGTFVNKNGLIETAPANVPRFDYGPISGECRGLLIEESRSNYFHGTQLGNGGSVSDGTATGANGVTAKKFVPTLGSVAFPGIVNYTQYSIPAGSQVTGGTVDVSFSGYFAAVGNGLYVPDIVFSIGASGTNYIYAELLPDLTNGNIVSKSLNGAVGFSELIAPQITLMPFGMYKVTWSIRYTQGATIRNTVDFGIQCRRKNSPTGATGTYYADGINGFQFSCIQYEIGAFPTSYIPTTTSSVTRSADVASMTGTNFSSWYRQIGYTILSTHILPQNHRVYYPRIWNISSSTDVDRLNHYIDVNQAHIGFSAIENNSITQADIRSTSGFSQNQKMKMITRFEIDDTSLFINGRFIGRDNKVSYPSVTRTSMNIGSAHNNTSYLNSTIANIIFYPKALNDAQLQYLTQ